MNARAFLGPIGDDLPSLIPLIIGLVVFFSTFAFAFQTFDRGNDNFDTSIKVIKLAQALKGDSYVASLPDFRASCAQASARGINFYSALIDYPKALKTETDGFQRFNISHIMETHSGVVRAVADDLRTPEINESEENNSFFECIQPQDAQYTSSATLLVRMFPVALQYAVLCSNATVSFDSSTQAPYCTQSGFAVKPVTLVIAAWK